MRCAISRIGNIYVEIRGDYSKYKEDIQALKVSAKTEGVKVSDALNNAITPTKASQAINILNADLRQLAGAAKVPADSFKITADQISKDLGKIATSAGLTEKEFSKLTEKMLQTQAQKATEKSFTDIAKAAGLSHQELTTLGKQMGFSAEQMNKMGSVFGDANKTMDSQVSIASRLKSSWLAFAAAGVAVGGLVKGIKAFVDSASQAEQIEKRLQYTLETVGYSWESAKIQVDEYARSIQETTRYSDEEARQALNDMMIYTKDFAKAQQGATLAMDMSVRTGQDLHSTTQLIGMALSGNVERLGRYIPELRNLDDTLGKNATMAEKAEYAFKILQEKFGGTAQADIDSYAGKMKQLDNAWDDLKETLGKNLLPVLTRIAEGWHVIFVEMEKVLNPSVQQNFDAAVEKWTKARTALAFAENALREGTRSPWIMQQQIDLAKKAMAEAQVIIDQAGGQLKKIEEQKAAFQTIKDKPQDLSAKDAEARAKEEQRIAEANAKELARITKEAWDLQVKQLEEAEKQMQKVTDDFFEDKRKKQEEEGKRAVNLTKEIYDDETKSLYAAEKQIAEITQKYNDDKVADAKKTAEEEKRQAMEVWKLQKSISEDIAKLTKNDFDLRLNLLYQEYATRKEVVGESAELDLWLWLKEREILEEKALAYGTFWDGVKVQYDRNLRDQITWGQEGAKIWQGTFGKGGALEGTLNTFFDDVFAGELKTAEDYFKSFTDAILKMFAKMIAEMVAQWAAANIGGMIFDTGTSGVQGGTNIGGTVGNGLLNTAIDKGLSYATGGIGLTGSGALTQAGSLWNTGSLVNLGGDTISTVGAGSGLGSGAGGAGLGAAAGLGVGVAWVAAFAALMNWLGPKINIGSTEMGINPFHTYEGGIPGTWWLINPGGLPGLNEYDMSKVPSPEDLASKFRTQFGAEPPTSTNIKNLESRALSAWAMSIPEFVQAEREYQKWLEDHYAYIGGGEGGAYWEKANSHTGIPVGETIYAQHGGIIDEPMMAYGRSGKKILMGEAGREYIVPERKMGKFGGGPVSITLNVDGKNLGAVLLDLSKNGVKVVHQRGITAN